MNHLGCDKTIKNFVDGIKSVIRQAKYNRRHYACMVAMQSRLTGPFGGGRCFIGWHQILLPSIIPGSTNCKYESSGHVDALLNSPAEMGSYLAVDPACRCILEERNKSQVLSRCILVTVEP